MSKATALSSTTRPGLSLERRYEQFSRLKVQSTGQSLEYLCHLRPGAKAILRNYTAMNGRPRRVQAW